MRTIITDCTASIKGLVKGDQVIVICGSDATFSPETVAALLGMNAKLITVSSDSVLFAMGVLAGQSGKPENVTVLTDKLPQSAVTNLGFSTKIGSGSKAEPAKRIRKRTQKTTPAEEMDPGEKSKEIDLPMPEPAVKKTGAEKTKNAVPSAFSKTAKACGVSEEDMEKVLQAVQDASDDTITYEMQLRLHLLDREKASDIFQKTKGKFSDLKKVSG